MFHETLTPLTVICFVLVAGPLSAADRLVDGVPLPQDAKAATVLKTDTGTGQSTATSRSRVSRESLGRP
jgi:hypothetical protein